MGIFSRCGSHVFVSISFEVGWVSSRCSIIQRKHRRIDAYHEYSKEGELLSMPSPSKCPWGWNFIYLLGHCIPLSTWNFCVSQRLVSHCDNRYRSWFVQWSHRDVESFSTSNTKARGTCHLQSLHQVSRGTTSVSSQIARKATWSRCWGCFSYCQCALRTC